MALLQVTGFLTWEDTYFCGCEYCEGHGTGKTIEKEVNGIVDARNEQEAINLILACVVPGDILDTEGAMIEWLEGPYVSDCSPDKAMRMARYVGWWDSLIPVSVNPH